MKAHFLERDRKTNQMAFKLILSSILFISCNLFAIGAESDSVNQKELVAPLFASEEPLKFTLIIDVKTVRNDDSEDPQYSAGKLILHEGSSQDADFDIQVKARGHSRRLFNICSFPPIKLNFKKKAVKGTIFEGQDKLKLVAFCRDLDQFQDYVLQEYLVYKAYNCLTAFSFKVRLAKITYKDLNDKSKEVQRYGFLIEDDELMAQRNGGKITEALMSNQDRCERETLDIFTLFQFMIGNADWWIAKPIVHNVKLIFREGSAIVPVPYDFDYSGTINAKYAVPPEELPIQSVRERYFRGYCRMPGTYEKSIEVFNERKEELYGVYRNFKMLDEKKIKLILKYYDEFYKIINDPKLVKRKIYDNCQINHSHLHKIKKTK
jgi:hypothetical protein